MKGILKGDLEGFVQGAWKNLASDQFSDAPFMDLDLDFEESGFIDPTGESKDWPDVIAWALIPEVYITASPDKDHPDRSIPVSLSGVQFNIPPGGLEFKRAFRKWLKEHKDESRTFIVRVPGGSEDAVLEALKGFKGVKVTELKR